MLRTSRPCAVTTSGASRLDAISPAGTRKCAQTTSGRAARRTLRAQPEVAPLASGAAIEHGELELVAALAQRVGELGDEHAEVGIGRPGIHLRDDEDAH